MAPRAVQHRFVNRGLLVLPALALVVSVGATSVHKSDAATDTALGVLSGIPVQKERPSGYRRELFTHWVDADGDQCNTREEVLIAESSSLPQVDPYGCKVVEGDWWSPYDDTVHTDPSELDIDHLVPLKEAWDSGAWAWSASKRRAYANDLSDPRPLIAVTAGVNRSKGDKDPSNWLPSNSAYVCTYVSDWVAVKSRWGLSMDASEFGRVRNVLSGQCKGTSLAPWGTPRANPRRGSGSQATADTTTAVKGATTFKPGQFCTPIGATGTYKGASYVCATSNAQGVPYKDSRARWRKG